MSNIFLSYARLDIRKARRLYDVLRADTNHDVWFDKVSLLPGASWEPAIRKAIREADYFLALLSIRSVTARGYRHSELRQAMEVLAEFPSDQIYLIPARLDDCEMPDPLLNKIHRVDLFPRWKEGFQAIVQTLAREAGGPKKEVVRGEGVAQYRVGLIGLNVGEDVLPGLATELNYVQSFFRFEVLKAPTFRRVSKRIDGSSYFDVDGVPDTFFERAKYLAVDLVACCTRQPLAFSKGNYLYFNYFATSTGPQKRFLFLSLAQLDDLTAVVHQTVADGLAYLLVGELVDFFTDFGYHEETRGCLMDKCEQRSDLAYGLKARRLCKQCVRKIKTPRLREAVDAMLKWRSSA